MTASDASGAKKLVCVGIAGSILAALCCATPILVLLLGAVGLSAWLGWLDYVLLPAMGAFVGMTLWGLWRQRRAAAVENTESA